MLIGSPLFTCLRPMAESVGVRGGHLVPLRFGSMAAELALSTRSVGMVDREDITVSRLRAGRSTIDALLLDHADCVPAPGEVVSLGPAHIGRLADGELLVARPADAPCPPIEEMHDDIRVMPGAWQLASLATIELLGPATLGLLTDLGVAGALEWDGETGRVTVSRLAADRVVWMVVGNDRALAFVDPAAAVAAWARIGEAGRRFDLGYVGAEAAERLELVRCRAGEPSIA